MSITTDLLAERFGKEHPIARKLATGGHKIFDEGTPQGDIEAAAKHLDKKLKLTQTQEHLAAVAVKKTDTQEKNIQTMIDQQGSRGELINQHGEFGIRAIRTITDAIKTAKSSSEGDELVYAAANDALFHLKSAEISQDQRVATLLKIEGVLKDYQAQKRRENRGVSEKIERVISSYEIKANGLLNKTSLPMAEWVARVFNRTFRNKDRS